MKVAIIDDEFHGINNLEYAIKQIFPQIEIVFTTTLVEEAAEKLKQISIDLLFLDIQMPGMNGFELLDSIPKRNFDVIFVTAHSEYAIEAFRAGALNYLLKPVDEDDLKIILETWKEKSSEELNENQKKIEEMMLNFHQKGLMRRKISVPISGGYQFLEVENIMYCQSSSNYTEIFLDNGKSLMISKTLKMISAILEPYFFIRIHKSFLINPDYLTQYSRTDGGFVVMNNGKSIPVSKDKREMISSLFQ